MTFSYHWLTRTRAGAVLVTTPQDVAIADVRRALRMFETVAIPVLGIVENMSYFLAPDTGTRYNIFGEGGGERLANTYHVPFLGAVPLGMEVRRRRQGRSRGSRTPRFTASKGFSPGF